MNIKNEASVVTWLGWLKLTLMHLFLEEQLYNVIYVLKGTDN